MTIFIKVGNTFNVSPTGALDIQKTLPTATYFVKFNEQTSQYFVELAESFTDTPKKIYGDTAKTADRILNTYQDRPQSTGVLLTGEKGSGKTMLAKLLASNAAKKDIPTLIINSPFCGDVFNKFIQSIEQECIVMFDEFEKVYDRDDQKLLLTLLDGVFPQKKLFILTCNDMLKMDINLINRPGRIFYAITYKGLDSAFVREYLDENLNNKGHIEEFVSTSTALFTDFNFDMLKALVEEMNRYDEPIASAMKFVNTRPDSSSAEYVLTAAVDGEAVKIETWCNRLYTSPLSMSNFHVEFDVDEDDKTQDAMISSKDLVSMDTKRGTFTFVKGNVTVIATKQETKPDFNYMDFIAY